ncbi:MAG: hypothetical protein WCT31_00385 [Candidatus Micrarchaeia archaeon]|jgi:hypothetical protein
MSDIEKTTVKPTAAIVGNRKPETQAVPKPPEKSPEEKKKDEKMAAIIKELEQAFFTIKFYPVAAKEEAKNEAMKRIETLYSKEDDTVKQLILYMVHEHISQIGEARTMHNFEHFKRKNPAADPGQLRISVYRAMFNYNFSIEGIVEFINLLGRLEGDDAAKLLTYHYTFLSSTEGETMHILKNAVLNALGESNSTYALHSLMTYAHLTDHEMTLGRIAASLAKWNDKIDSLKISKKEKEELKQDLEKMMTLEHGSSHYG